MSLARHALAVALVLPLLVAAETQAATDLAPTARKRVVLSSFEMDLSGWRGYNATLSRVDGGSSSAVRVSLVGSATSYSLYPVPRQVSRTSAGTTYTAAAAVRAVRPGARVCLRVREWSGGSVVGAAERCVTTTADWQRVPAVAHTARRDGGTLDAYVYQWLPAVGASFDADWVQLTTSGAAPAPAPAPAPPTSVGAAAVDHAHIRVSWPPVAGATVYRVRRGGLLVGETAETSFVDALLWPQTRYDYAVEARDAAGSVLRTVSAGATTQPLPATGFPRPFAQTSFWNTPIGPRPDHPRNAALTAYFRSKAINANLTLRRWAVAVSEAHRSDPRVSIPCTRYACTLGAFGPVPIPATAAPDPAGDGHLAIVDPELGREWGMWQATTSTGRWTASAGAAVSLAGDGVAPRGTASGNAANFPMLGGLIRPEEILQGRIDHALVFGLPGIGEGPPVCPATHNAPTTTHPDALREGQLLQLDPSLNVDALAVPAWQKTIMRALQRYGMYLRDNSGSFAIYAENPIARGYDAWAKVGLTGSSVSLASLPWSRFRVVAAPDC